MDWKKELSQSITSPNDLPRGFTLLPGEDSFFQTRNREHVLPFRITPYYFSLIDSSHPDDPVRKQCIPTAEEFRVKEYEDMDPLREKEFEPIPSLVHRYENRVLLRVTGQCAAYCRHCFRRFVTGKMTGIDQEKTLDLVCAYLTSHPEIDEVLISGGDPLILDDHHLFHLLHTLRKRSKKIILRLCTRMPVVLPFRITVSFAKTLASFAPLWIVTHFNHPNELTPQSREAIAHITSHGIPVLDQTVLLRGINDDPGLLYTLFHRLTACMVKPYYLFQGDLACGTAHFRVNLKKGFSIYDQLKKKASGLSLPQFSLDLPRGGGKILLSSSVYTEQGEWYVLKDYNGKEYYYPVEHEPG